MVKNGFLLAVLIGFVVICGAAEQKSAEKPDMALQLKSDLDQLVELKVVLSPDYWLEHAVKGRSCGGEEVVEFLIGAAKHFGPAGNLDQALEVLKQRKIVLNDYWAKNALPGKKCNGEYVGNVIRAAAQELRTESLIKKYGSQPGIIPCPLPSAFSPQLPFVKSNSINYIIGTQTFGPRYQFTKKTKLAETAEAIMEMGATVIKFELSRRYAKPNGNVVEENAKIICLTDLVRDEPSHRKVLDMPFTYYVLWAHTFSGGGWNRGFKKEVLDAEYREMYDFTCYLLKAYSGSGKTFYLGHWEGDGWLRGTVAKENDVKVTPEAVQSMADWLNTRQRAIDDAKRDTAYNGVQVWHYTEVNHVWLAMEGRPALVNMVLPKTAVDLVSYSSYDTASSPEKFKAALNYIESKLSPKPAITGRRIFVGEYGFPAEKFPPEKQDAMSRQLIRAALEWGCPFVLYWEMYNNEVEDGRQRGFWMIDDKGIKQPVYYTHREFYKWARKYYGDMVQESGRNPSYDEFRENAVTFLKTRK